MSRYQVWNRTDSIVTPSGEVFTPEQWTERYPVANILDTICGGKMAENVSSGSVFGIYNDFIKIYEQQGCDFTGCKNQQDKLDKIEQFEDERNAIAHETASTDERIAAALEAQTMMAMDDVTTA